MNNPQRLAALQELEDLYSAGKISYDEYLLRLREINRTALAPSRALQRGGSRKRPYVVGGLIALAVISSGLVLHQAGAVQFGSATEVAAETAEPTPRATRTPPATADRSDEPGGAEEEVDLSEANAGAFPMLYDSFTEASLKNIERNGINIYGDGGTVRTACPDFRR
jgi:hypothetical protein